MLDRASDRVLRRCVSLSKMTPHRGGDLSTSDLTDEQYEDYLGLRSRFLNLVYISKRPGRQLRRLEQALDRADEAARSIAMSELTFTVARDTLAMRMPAIERDYHRHPL
ncbi:MAG TPA: hypothetical protein VFK97_02470, partial [Candidatus Saccharimonadales bacterium]|nr:hypothetical protein [Candidatus Saccharimonadales bacterium]